MNDMSTWTLRDSYLASSTLNPLIRNTLKAIGETALRVARAELHSVLHARIWRSAEGKLLAAIAMPVRDSEFSELRCQGPNQTPKPAWLV